MNRLLRQLYNLYFSHERSYAQQLKSVLGFAPADISLYRLALQHSSAFSGTSDNNERLELLGDAVIGLSVTEILYDRYPDRKEGFLTEMRSKIVNRKQLNGIALAMGLGELIHHTASEQDFIKSSIAGNSLEALVGAVYLDLGWNRAHSFVIDRLLRRHLDLEHLRQSTTNFKSKLLEWCQKRQKRLQFRTLDQELEGNKWRYTMGAFIDGEQIAKAADFSKKKAEQRAAKKALRKLDIED